MLSARTVSLTSIAMVAFAGNSLLCRVALKQTSIDVTSFTTIRLISGAMMLCLIVSLRHGTHKVEGSWLSALALFVYAAGFSFAYVSLPTAMGALLLFGAVQSTMIGYGVWKGERLLKLQFMGLALALCGLVSLLLPSLSTPPLKSSLLMLSAGVAWGVYSLRGKGSSDAIRVTAGNFLRAATIAVVFVILMLNRVTLDITGFWYAVASGALASGIGYAMWYSVLPELKSVSAATVQLSVPVIAALGGIAILGEPISLRLVLASVAILGGIAMVIMEKQQG